MLAAASAYAADLGTPRLSDDFTRSYFNPDRFLTGGSTRSTPRQEERWTSPA